MIDNNDSLNKALEHPISVGKLWDGVFPPYMVSQAQKVIEDRQSPLVFLVQPSEVTKL